MSKKALVLDDTEISRVTISAFLSVCGFEVETVANGFEGLKSLTNDKYDLIFSDLEMPIMGGFEFLKKVKNDPQNKEIPVIILTGIDGDEIAEKAKLLGASSYMNKPYNREKMIIALKSAGFNLAGF